MPGAQTWLLECHRTCATLKCRQGSQHRRRAQHDVAAGTKPTHLRGDRRDTGRGSLRWNTGREHSWRGGSPWNLATRFSHVGLETYVLTYSRFQRHSLKKMTKVFCLFDPVYDMPTSNSRSTYSCDLFLFLQNRLNMTCFSLTKQAKYE